jgi:MOSC domain-containing protein YiiM
VKVLSVNVAAPEPNPAKGLGTAGVDVNGASIGEIWKIGDVVELQATFGRIPCATSHR